MLVAGGTAVAGLSASPANAAANPTLSNGFAISINDRGQAVGEITATDGGTNAHVHALAWDRAGRATDLARFPGGSDAVADSINNVGEIAGYAETSAGDYHAARWSPNGQITSLDKLPGSTDNAAHDINDAGVVVGVAQLPDALDDLRPVRWNRAGQIAPLALPSGATEGEASAINNAGVIVGAVGQIGGQDRHAVRWSPAGRPTSLSVPAGTVASFAYGVNDAGVIAGIIYVSATVFHAVRWNLDGTVTDLGAAQPAGSVSGVVSVSASGATAGSSGQPGSETAVRWTAGGRAERLATVPGQQRSFAQGMNAFGVAVGDFIEPNDNSHAVRWNLDGTVTRLADPGAVR